MLLASAHTGSLVLRTTRSTNDSATRNTYADATTRVLSRRIGCCLSSLCFSRASLAEGMSYTNGSSLRIFIPRSQNKPRHCHARYAARASPQPFASPQYAAHRRHTRTLALVSLSLICVHSLFHSLAASNCRCPGSTISATGRESETSVRGAAPSYRITSYPRTSLDPEVDHGSKTQK